MVRAVLPSNTEVMARSPVLASSDDGTPVYGWVEQTFFGFWEGVKSEEAMAIEQAAQIYRYARLFVAPSVVVGESDEVRPIDAATTDPWWEVVTITDRYDDVGLHHHEVMARRVIESR